MKELEVVFKCSTCVALELHLIELQVLNRCILIVYLRSQLKDEIISKV